MRILLTLVSLGLAASPCWSQFYVPAQSDRDQFEANDRTNYPLMRAESRSQYILSPSEVGPPATLTQLALRFNGPTYSAAGRQPGLLLSGFQNRVKISQVICLKLEKNTFWSIDPESHFLV